MEFTKANFKKNKRYIRFETMLLLLDYNVKILSGKNK